MLFDSDFATNIFQSHAKLNVCWFMGCENISTYGTLLLSCRALLSSSLSGQRLRFELLYVFEMNKSSSFFYFSADIELDERIVTAQASSKTFEFTHFYTNFTFNTKSKDRLLVVCALIEDLGIQASLMSTKLKISPFFLLLLRKTVWLSAESIQNLHWVCGLWKTDYKICCE